MKKIYSLSFLSILCLVAISTAVQGIAWNQKANFTGNRYGAFGFAIGQKGYIACGVVNTPTGYALMNDFWEYDKNNDQWTQKVSMPGSGRISAATFTSFGYGYVTTGYDLVNFLQDTWQYDPLSNAWTAKPDFPGVPRYNCAYFNVSDDGYVGMGYSGGYFSDFYRFDGLTNTWNAVASIPGTPRTSAEGFSIGNNGYVVGGAVEVPPYNTKELWCYSPITNTWTQKTDYPGNGSHGLASFVMNGHGLVGCGSFVSATNSVFSDFYEYDPMLDSWTLMPDFGGGIRQGPVALTIGNTGFVGTGSSAIYPQINYQSDWWSFDNFTGVAENSENTQQVTTYFNNGNLYLQFSLQVEKNTKTFIFDNSGKLVASIVTSQSENTILIENLNASSGIYYYSIEVPNGKTFTGKIATAR